MSDFENFKEELTGKEMFSSFLLDKKIIDKGYQHVLNVWKKIEMKAIKYYSDLYSKCGVLLLAEMFQKIRQNSFKNYGLCPSHYLSAPDLSWDAVPKMTMIELERIPDTDMYIFLDKGIKGGTSYISNRYSKSNNKHLKSFDPKQEWKYIIYLDANNLYGYAMSKLFSKSGFK